MLDRLFRRVRRRFAGLQRRVRQRETHGALLERLLAEHGHTLGPRPVMVETGCGVSTPAFARAVARLGGRLYSLDVSEEKVAALRRDAGSALAGTEFLIGDSLAGLQRIVALHQRVHFVLLDSAPSAMHTFREFLVLEPHLGPGSWVVIDNAALPGRRRTLSPARKGRVLVPYLQASSLWEVFEYPNSGDSMVAARRHATPDYADPAYELAGYVDPWPDFFAQHLGRVEAGERAD